MWSILKCLLSVWVSPQATDLRFYVVVFLFDMHANINKWCFSRLEQVSSLETRLTNKGCFHTCSLFNLASMWCVSVHHLGFVKYVTGCLFTSRVIFQTARHKIPRYYDLVILVPFYWKLTKTGCGFTKLQLDTKSTRFNGMLSFLFNSYKWYNNNSKLSICAVSYLLIIDDPDDFNVWTVSMSAGIRLLAPPLISLWWWSTSREASFLTISAKMER